MAQLSDQLLVVAILAYVAAMVGYAAEYAFGRSGAIARAATREPVAIGAGGAGADTAETSGEGGSGSADSAASPPTQEIERLGAAWAGRAAVVSTMVGVVAHIGCLVTRALAAGRVPWGNMYEFILVVTLVGVVGWLGLLTRRPAVRPLGLYVALGAVVLLGLAAMRVYAAAGPLVPALNSAWLKIHVSAAAVASGVFLLGFTVAALYLIRRRADTKPADSTGLVSTLATHLPPPEVLERLAFRLHAFAFPVWTFAVLTGAIWAEAAWGRYWGWDPKETWAFISWVVYAAYLHARATPSVKRTTTAWLAVVGWVTMMFNLFAVNLIISGLHSYAGTS